MMAKTETAPDLDAIRARLEATTPAPWEAHDTGIVLQPETDDEEAEDIARAYRMDDADFIAHAPEDIRALLREVARLRGELEDLKLGARGW